MTRGASARPPGPFAPLSALACARAALLAAMWIPFSPVSGPSGGCCVEAGAPRTGGLRPQACAGEAIPPTVPELRAIRERIRRAVSADSAVSLSIAVVAGDRTVWGEAFGLADRERSIRATPGTPYAIASVTKPVTATAVMRLVEAGALELDAPANAYLGEPGLHGPRDWAARATVRHLLRHRAGLPTHFHFIYADEAFDRPSMEETIRRYGIVLWPPGSRSVYSNLGYGVLERLVEIVDGRDYGTFLREEVFTPLGMERAGVAVPGAGRPDASEPCVPAVGYAFDGERLPGYDFDHRGASAVVATARGMARFGASHFDRPPPGVGAVLTRKARRAMRTPPTDADGNGRGLGWSLRRHRTGTPLIEHSGGMPGTLSMLRVAPEARVSVFAVSNSETSALPALVSAVALDTLLSGRMLPGPLRERLAGRWCGTLETWRTRKAVELRIRSDGGSARAFWPGRAEPVPVEGFRVEEDGRVTGTLDVRIDTPDAARAPHYVRLELYATRAPKGSSGVEEVMLTGAALAMAVGPVSDRVRYGLPSALALGRECPVPERSP